MVAWPRQRMRGTLYLVPASDVRWLLDVVRPGFRGPTGAAAASSVSTTQTPAAPLVCCIDFQRMDHGDRFQAEERF